MISEKPRGVRNRTLPTPCEMWGRPKKEGGALKGENPGLTENVGALRKRERSLQGGLISTHPERVFPGERRRAPKRPREEGFPPQKGERNSVEPLKNCTEGNETTPGAGGKEKIVLKPQKGRFL